MRFENIKMSAMRRVCLVLALACLASACATPEIKEQVSGEFAAQGLHKVKNSGFAHAYSRPDAAFSSYRDVDIQALNVSDVSIPTTVVAGTSRRDWEMTPERQANLQSIWSDAMNRAFSSYGRLTDGPDVLRITAQLTQIAPGRPTATTIGGPQPLGSSQDVIEIWAEFRLFNAANGELLAVIRDNRTLTSFALSRTAPATIRQLFGSWASLLHTRVSGK